MTPEEVARMIHEEWSEGNREYPPEAPGDSCKDCRHSLWHPDCPVAWCKQDEEWYSIEREGYLECWEGRYECSN